MSSYNRLGGSNHHHPSHAPGSYMNRQNVSKSSQQVNETDHQNLQSTSGSTNCIGSSQ